MTSGERLLRCFRRDPVDRIPIALILDYFDRFGFDAFPTLGGAWDQRTLDKP